MSVRYEELYSNLQPDLKKLGTVAAAAVAASKASTKAIDSGKIKDFDAQLEKLHKQLASLTETIDALQATRDTFNVDEYFGTGNYAEDVGAICKERNIDVQIEGNTYRMFPVKVIIDGKNANVTLDKKKFAPVRPKALVDQIQINQDKLRKASFNAKIFGKELAAAYDSIITSGNKRPGEALNLIKVYQTMTPMSRARKEYDYQAFSFDVMRMETTTDKVLEDGRKLSFGPTRTGGTPVRFLDANGTEHFFYTVSIEKQFTIGEDDQ